jgi:hypothetical protein
MVMALGNKQVLVNGQVQPRVGGSGRTWLDDPDETGESIGAGLTQALRYGNGR